MAKKRKVALEGGGVGRTTLFPTIEDIGIGTEIGKPRRRIMTDEQLLGPKWWGKLQIALEARQSPESLMKKARKLIISVESTLSEVTDIDQGVFSHAIDGEETPPGTLRKVMDGKHPAFTEAFNSKFWSRPVGDLTIRDVNKILPEELREANFGKPTKKETPPGVV